MWRGDPGGQVVEFAFGEGGEIPLDPVVVEECGRGAELQVVLADEGEQAFFDVRIRVGVGEVEQPVQVVIEVDSLPRVEDHGPRRGRMSGAGAQVFVEAAGRGVESAAVGGVHPGGLVRLAGGQDDLAGQKQFAAAEHSAAGRHTFGVMAVVTAEADVQAPGLAALEAEVSGAREQDGGSVGPVRLDLAAARRRGRFVRSEPFCGLGVMLVAVLDEAVPAGWLMVTRDEPSRMPSTVRPDLHASRELKVIQPVQVRTRSIV